MYLYHIDPGGSRERVFSPPRARLCGLWAGCAPPRRPLQSTIFGTIPAGGRQCSRARTPDLEGAPCLHVRVARFYGGSCTPAGSQAVVTLHWRCTGYFFRGIPSKELTSEGPARHSPRRRCKTLVTPLGHTTQGTVLARCITGSRSGSPPPHAGMKKRRNLGKSRAGLLRSRTGFLRSPPRRAGQYRVRGTHRTRAPDMGGAGRGESPV